MFINTELFLNQLETVSRTSNSFSRDFKKSYVKIGPEKYPNHPEEN